MAPEIPQLGARAGVQQSVTFAVPLVAALALPDAGWAAHPVYETAGVPTPPARIDELVLARIGKAGLERAPLCSDAVFLRRVYLDVTGTLPAARDAAGFLADRDPGKRRALIERLLDSGDFADYWAMKWGDILRVKAEFPVNLWPNAAQAYHRWIRASIRDNKPYDHFARELLTESGSNFRSPPVNFYRALENREPSTIAKTVALTFLGMRAEKWPPPRLAGMAAFFSQIRYKETREWKEEIVYFDPRAPRPPARFPDGAAAPETAGRDPREVFADWLVSPKNRYFARNVANRVWSWLMGRGIVHEPDDFRDGNPPANPELLAYLERELTDARYDLKHLYRLILNSQTYQLSSLPRSSGEEADRLFAHYPARRLEAEVLIDAICQITGTSERYVSPIPEPFTYMPEDQRAIALPDGSTTSPFLELFGRPPRDTGLESERNNRPTAAQRLHLLNSSHIQRKIEQGPKMMALLRGARNPRNLVAALYLTILSRYPTEQEMRAIGDYSEGGKGREAAVDLAWALINSTEFLYRH